MTLLDAALSYAKRGWFVLPIYEPVGPACACGDEECKHPGKHPRTTHGYLDATTDEAQIHAWWSRWPRANVGIATGPSGLIVLDVDPRHGGDESMHDLIARHGAIDTPIVLTGGGGEQLYMVASIVTASRANALGSGYPGIDVRAEGAYAVAPPSQHISGKTYRWELSSPEKLAHVPSWLAALLAESERVPIAGADEEVPIVEGQRNATLARIAGRLRRQGMIAQAIEDALLAMNSRQCAPPLPKREVCAIARSVGRYFPAQRGAEEHPKQPRAQPPTFVRAAELLAQVDDDCLEYAVEGVLPLGGTAVLAGRPKGGKSTLALNLGLAVARGEPFLGRQTRKGPVLYLALEGAPRGWKALLRKLGVTNRDDLLICIGRAPEAAIAWLADEIEKHKPVLVIVDTMQRLLRVKDGNDYATGSNATDAVIELARGANASLLMLHHAGRTRHAEVVDEVMGSTAWAAAPDTVLVLRRSERFRTLASEQRFGENLTETVLAMDPETHRIQGGGPKADADRREMREAIIAFLGQYGEAHPDDFLAEEPAIMDGVEGRTKAKREALREAAAAGEVGRKGTGKKGDPYLYGLSRFLVPNHMQEQENENPEIARNSDEIRPNACSGDSDIVPEDGTIIRDGGNESQTIDLADELFAFANERIRPNEDSGPRQTELDL